MSRKVDLNRTLGLWEVTLSGIGITLGAGIYALLGEAAALAGNAVWMAFALSSIVAIFTGLSYAELSSMYPLASAEYEYTSRAFGKSIAFVIGWLIIFSGMIGAATVALGFAGYFHALAGAPMAPSAMILIMILSAIIFIGIKQSALIAIAFTIIEALGLIIIIVLGIPHFGAVDYLEMPLGPKGVFQAAALIFFAFIGFEEIVKLSEEVKEPEKTVPRGLILAISGSIILYVLVSISAVSILGWQELSRSSAPFADIAFAAFGRNASLILSVMAIFATIKTVLLMILASSRIIYGMAESSSLPRVLAAVHLSTRTPWAAITLAMIVSIAFVFAGDIAFVANINNYTVFVTFIFVNAALIVLRRKEPDAPRPFKVPLSLGSIPLLPAFGLVLNIFMLLQLSIYALAIGITLTLAGGIISLMKQ